MKIEERICIKCGETKEIPQPKDHANNICLDCARTASREYQKKVAIKDGRRIGVMGRFPYPLEGKWAYPVQKFNAMAKKMKYIMEREQWVEQIKINLEETMNNPLVMDWIKSAKDDDKPAKRQKKINKEYPDTRGMTWEEYTKGLGKDDVDS
jgi:hypothetical protein